MHEFIENNKRLLTIYCVVARIIGWILLIVPVIGSIWFLIGTTAFRDGKNRIFLLSWPESIVNICILGVIALGVAAFIRYLFEAESHPGWILRHSGMILFVGAVLILVTAILKCIFIIYIMHSREGNIGISSIFFGLLMPTVLCAAKVLILVGLGKILRRLMPVIEESKSLV